MATKFYLNKRQGKKGDCPIIVSVSIRGMRMLTSIGYSIAQSKWSPVDMEVQRGCHNSKGIPFNVINTRIRTIESAFMNYELSLNHRPSLSAMKSILTGIKGSNGPNGKVGAVERCFNEYMAYGVRTRQWSAGSQSNVLTLFSHLRSWKCKSVERLREEDFPEFLDYLRSKGLRESTVRKNYTLLKAFLEWAAKEGYCSDGVAVKSPKFRIIKNPVVFLRDDELMKVFGYDLPDGEGGPLSVARDLFCFCCATSLRYSDMVALKVSDIVDDSLKVVTKKTDTPLVIELNDISRTILNRYRKWNLPDSRALPFMRLSRLNRLIRKVGCICSIDSPVTKSYYIKGMRNDVTLPKWRFLSSHCGRRTFICYALSRGIPPQIVMKWTGHADYKAMQPYIDVACEDRAKAMKKLFRNKACPDDSSNL
ncbi:MAG: tyrosine-type recombinase/integrase [Candidatus Cryptobacteroides sp.]